MRESIAYRRSAALPGIEVLDAASTGRRFEWFHTTFGFWVPATWSGEVEYRRRVQAVGPGMAFCPEPGEISTMPTTRRAGTFHAVMCDPQVFEDAAAQRGAVARLPPGGVVARLSARFQRRTERLVRAVGSRAASSEIQSSFVEFVEAVVHEIVHAPRNPPPPDVRETRRRRGRPRREDVELDLDRRWHDAAMSRYQFLRAFKRKYGLPPHAYELAVRIGLARELLKEGHSATDVSAELEFADPSHFSRHFKRQVGVTPGTYA